MHAVNNEYHSVTRERVRNMFVVTAADRTIFRNKGYGAA